MKGLPALSDDTAALVRKLIDQNYSDGRIAYLLSDHGVLSWKQITPIRLNLKAAANQPFPGLDPKLWHIKTWYPCAIIVGPEGVIVDVELTVARLR